MKLSDIMSATDLGVYAEIGLLISFVCFVVIVLGVLRPGRAQELAELRALPLTEPEELRAGGADHDES